MKHTPRLRTLALALSACALAACSGSSGDGPTTVSLTVTDAASDELSTFVIGLESVELQRAVGGPVSLLQLPVAVDFAALTDLSRVLNVLEVPEDVYTGIEIVLLFDGDRVHLAGQTTPATLLDSDGNALAGTLTLDIAFPAPFAALPGHYEVELDLDLNQSLVVDGGGNDVYLEPTLIPRINPGLLKEHAIGGALRTVVLADDLFRISLDSPIGVPPPVVTIETGPGTVFQVDGVCLLGAAGLSALDALAPGTWVQAFGTVQNGSSSFAAATVETGSGSYNGGTDIVEGLITGISGSQLTVLGHSNNAAHDTFTFNLDFQLNTDLGNTKVVRRGNVTQFAVDDLNVGQRVRAFGALTIGPPHVMDVTAVTDVVRTQPVTVYGVATAAPSGSTLTVDVSRVGLRDVSAFSWAQGGATPPNPDAMVVDVGTLWVGKGITMGSPVEFRGFFSPQSDAGADFTASALINREFAPTLLVVRDRLNGMTVTPTVTSSQIDLAFAGVPTGFEKAAVDQGFMGDVDVTATGITIEPQVGLGIYTIRDKTLQTYSLYFTFGTFTQGLQDAFTGGATLFNLGAVGPYDAGTDTITTSLMGVVVQ